MTRARWSRRVRGCGVFLLIRGRGRGRGWDGVPVTAQVDAGDVVLPG